MKKITQKIKNFSMILVVVMVSVFVVSAAWATLTFVTPADNHTQISSVKGQDNGEAIQKTKARAPEPATMVLFGGGFFGMLVSFIRNVYARTKRIFDLILAILGAILLSPAMILTALLVKLTSKGPAIYTQTRVGLNGKHFKIYKFRTMKVDAEKNSGPVWATKNDNRLTPVGNFLRKSRLDELPQFFNIIQGNMSLIGPRPERPIFVEKFKQEISDYEKRLQIKPGITGLAQVWHRYDETIADVRKKIKYDLLYIKKCCFWTDLRILFRTVRVVLTGSGAR